MTKFLILLATLFFGEKNFENKNSPEIKIKKNFQK